MDSRRHCPPTKIKRVIRGEPVGELRLAPETSVATRRLCDRLFRNHSHLRTPQRNTNQLVKTKRGVDPPTEIRRRRR